MATRSTIAELQAAAVWKKKQTNAVDIVSLQTRTRAAEVKKKRHTSASGLVSDHIVALINRGRLRPGDKLLSEHGLMDLLHVGRSSVREAIRGLVMAGVLESRQKRGTVVVSRVTNGFPQAIARSAAYWGIRDMEEVRMLLECFAARRAAEIATAEQIAELERRLVEVEDRIAGGVPYFSENTRFHLMIARIAHNNALTYCLASIIEDFREPREELNLTHNDPVADLREHRAIFDAVRLHNPDEAHRTMQVHLRRNVDRLEIPEGARRHPGDAAHLAD